MTVVFVPLSVNSTSEQGASIPDEFQSDVVKPPGIAARSWWEVVTPESDVEAEPSSGWRTILPALVFWTLSDISYIFVASQLMWTRLGCEGTPLGALQTTTPSGSMM